MFGSIFKNYKLCSIFGVDVSINGSTLAVAALFILGALFQSGYFAALEVTFIVSAVMLCVTLHELGHIFAGHLFGIGTTGLTLYPIGGIARLTREAKTPIEEIVIAIAGPAVNVVLATLALVSYVALPFDLILNFMFINIGLAIFNMVPAYPMDGGRVVRGIFWAIVGYAKGTQWAARGGQVFAVLFVIAGLKIGHMSLPIIGFFIFTQASAEYRRVSALRLAEASRSGLIFDRFYEGPRPTIDVGYSGYPRPATTRKKPFIQRTASGRIIFVQEE